MVSRFLTAAIPHKTCQTIHDLVERSAKCQLGKYLAVVLNFISTKHTARKTQEARPVPSAKDIVSALDPDTTVVAIDEVQFFDGAVVDVCDALAEDGKRVICAGLDMDFRGVPFGPMPQLMARAEEVRKLHAICVVCGDEASRTQRLIDDKPAAFDDPVVLVGASEVYEARCRQCHELSGREKVER